MAPIHRALSIAALVAPLLCTLTSRADVVTDWNVIALNATAQPPNSILQSRSLAIVRGAIYDAVCAVERSGTAYAVLLEAPSHTSLDAAVAAAAHAALERLAPAAKPVLDVALSDTLAKIADGPAKQEGVALGARIAARSVALRSEDGADAKVSFTPKSGIAQWAPTPPLPLPPILPQ